MSRFDFDDDNEDMLGGVEDAIGEANSIMDIHGSNSLAGKVALRGKQWADLNNRAAFVRINPESVLTGTIGNQAIVQTGKKVQVANWAGDDAETVPITVTLAPVQQLSTNLDGGGGVELWRPYGIVQFGTRGSLVEFEVDIGRGCQFTISGSTATLQVAMADTTNVSAAITSMKLAGMLSFYPVERTPPVTRTIYIDALTDAASAPILTVPAFAKSVSFWRDSPSEFDVNVAFQDPNNTMYTYKLQANAYMTDPIPLSGDISSFVVWTTSMSINASRTRAIFNLAI